MLQIMDVSISTMYVAIVLPEAVAELATPLKNISKIENHMQNIKKDCNYSYFVLVVD